MYSLDDLRQRVAAEDAALDGRIAALLHRPPPAQPPPQRSGVVPITPVRFFDHPTPPARKVRSSFVVALRTEWGTTDPDKANRRGKAISLPIG